MRCLGGRHKVDGFGAGNGRLVVLVERVTKWYKDKGPRGSRQECEMRDMSFGATQQSSN